MSREVYVSNKKQADNFWVILFTFLKLGLTSFGGPIAHIGYFRDEFVTRRKWLGDTQFTELSSLCHFLPGPSSSQLGMMLGLYRGGIGGSFAAWLGFTIPSALIMLLLGLGIIGFEETVPSGLIHGLKIMTVAVVLQALIGMARNLTPDLPRLVIAIVSAIGLFLLSEILFQPLVIVFGGICGYFFLEAGQGKTETPVKEFINKKTALGILGAFFLCLVTLPVLSHFYPSLFLHILDGFYRSGSLVFGGGHVVLPLLNEETVAKGFVNEDAFLAGYAAAQAMPGPLFTFSAYLGAIMGAGVKSVVFSLVALLAIFAPAFLLVFGVLPFWADLRQKAVAGKILNGVNASVVGLLAAILYDPLWTSSIHIWHDFVFLIIIFCALFFLRIPVWICVLASALCGLLIF